MFKMLTEEKKKELLEKVKEILRWVVLFVVSWFITETLSQADLVPSTYTLHIWVFSYILPIKTLFVTALTMLGRFVDRLLHESGVAEKGLTRF